MKAGFVEHFFLKMLVITHLLFLHLCSYILMKIDKNIDTFFFFIICYRAAILLLILCFNSLYILAFILTTFQHLLLTSQLSSINNIINILTFFAEVQATAVKTRQPLFETVCLLFIPQAVIASLDDLDCP